MKGGSGATVVTAALAVLSAHAGGDVLLADLAGDLPAALGVAEPAGPGLADWLAAGPDVPGDALRQLEVEVTAHVALLPWCGEHPLAASDGDRLAAALAARPSVVADCGTAPVGAAHAVAAAADRSVLVIRPCYLAVRRAVASALRPTEVVVVTEDGRALSPGDIEGVLGAPVTTVIPWDGAIARAVDAGLLGRRLPRVLARSLEPVA